jgi:hypothetical protein
VNNHVHDTLRRKIMPAALLLAMAAGLLGVSDALAGTPLQAMKGKWTQLTEQLTGVAPTAAQPAAPAGDPGGINLLGVVYGTTSKIVSLPPNHPLKQQYDAAGRQLDAIDTNLKASWQVEFQLHDKINGYEYLVKYRPAQIAEQQKRLSQATSDAEREGIRGVIADMQAELSDANNQLPAARASLRQAEAASQAIQGQKKPLDDTRTRLTSQAEAL